MQRLDIGKVKPSMVLAMTIKDKNGNIVLLKGLELTERHIAILKNRDVKSLIVEGAPMERESVVLDTLLEEVDRRFSTAGSNPVVLKIRDIIKGLLA
ncbi:MAG: hypothetical protein M1510_08760 [Nitrospirae bacterium]|nr:hypothetical protein [Nitrospirota bacterium]MCL5238291.1 hypothetical protein [Nitrospirota bacterium]